MAEGDIRRMINRDPRYNTEDKIRAIVRAAREVHKELGRGFMESVYKEALATELSLQKIPFKRQVELPVIYKGQPLKAGFWADFVCFGSIIVEVKAIPELSGVAKPQLVNQMSTAGIGNGLILNFGAPLES
jgi:GxxExxY protein